MSSKASSAAGPSPPAPPPARWSLSIFTREPASLPLLESDPSLPHAIVFVPGLTDTFGTCPYLDRLAHGVAPFGFQVVQLQLSSSLGGFGYCSLEGDAEEMALAVSWLRRVRGTDKVILMGHSTGCQDAMAYLSHPAGSLGRGDTAVVDAAVLQAPVSDRESWESMYCNKDKDAAQDAASAETDGKEDKQDPVELLALAKRLVEEGKGAQLLPRNVPLVQPPESSEPTPQRGNVNAVWDSPMTAYRYWSLYAKGGHDDYFSTSDLSASEIHDIWKRAAHGLRQGSTGYVLGLVGGEDEYIPRPTITPQTIIASWDAALDEDAETKKNVKFQILDGANHKVDAAEAQVLLVAKVRELIKALGVVAKPGAATPTSRATSGAKKGPPPPPSLFKGIPAWQLGDAASPASVPSTFADSTKTPQPSDAAPKDSTATPLVTTTQTTTTSADDGLASSSQPVTQASVSTDTGLATGSSDQPSQAAGGVPPHPASFDALVELIASGRTDEIDGIRDIPLVINENEPSQSKLEATKKPWERAQEAAASDQTGGEKAEASGA